LTVVGAALDPTLGSAVRDAAARDPRITWLGSRPHAWTRQAIKRAHVLLVPSRMEGGANVVVEALTSATAVLGSRMSGNVGMLGADHPGYFPVGDAGALAALIARAHCNRDYLAAITRHGELRAPLFAPATEARALERVITDATISLKSKIAG
jgi:glycosyltransferase involved in cell wall biosynthesis